jgi:hypothetical protein
MILISDVLFFGNNCFVDFVHHHVFEKNMQFVKLISVPFLSYNGRRHQLRWVRKKEPLSLSTHKLNKTTTSI